MKKSLLLILLFAGITGQSRCQETPDTRIDSLQSVLKSKMEDTSKVSTLNELSAAMWDAADYNNSLTKANEAKALSEKIISEKASSAEVDVAKNNLGDAYYHISLALWSMGKTAEALKNDSAAIRIYEEKADKKQFAEALNIMGVMFKDMGNYTAALSSHKDALKIREEIRDTQGIAYSYKNIGVVYYEQANYPEALKYYFEGVKKEEDIGDKKGCANSYLNIANVYFELNNNKEAINNYLLALKYFQELNDRKGIAGVYNNIGNVYGSQNKLPEALENFTAALNIKLEIGDKKGSANSYLNIGIIYDMEGKYNIALKNYSAALKLFEEIGNKKGIILTFNNIGTMHSNQNRHADAIIYFNKAKNMAEEINDLSAIEESLLQLSISYEKLGDFKSAYKYHKSFTSIKDSIYNENSSKQINELNARYETEKKDNEITLLNKDKQLQQKELSKQKIMRNGFIAGFSVMLLFATVFFTQRNKIKKGKKRSDELLLNILPSEVAEELKSKGTAKAKAFTMVTVMFTDFKDFTTVSEKVSAELLVDEIHTCFSAFDNILQKHKIEKIKTIGDAYLCASGLPVSNYTHAVDMLNAAFEIRDYMLNRKKEKEAKGEIPFELRIGIHTGPVVAGIVGIKKYAYDIWGDTVNLAARMEQNSDAGKINISGSTYELVKDKYHCVHRGKIQAKNKGEIDMYFVSRSLSES